MLNEDKPKTWWIGKDAEAVGAPHAPRLDRPKMTQGEAIDAITAMLNKTVQLTTRLEYARSFIRQDGMADMSLQFTDEAIDAWNELINMAPRDLKRIKLEYLAK